MGFFRDLAASIIANTPAEQFLFSPPDKAKDLKELNEQMSSGADIKRQQAPRSLKAEEAFRIFRILIRVEKAKGKRQKAKGKRQTNRGKRRRVLPRVRHLAETAVLGGEETG